MSINKVILIGRLGATPELRFTENEKAVCNFSVATSEKWTDEAGCKHDRTEWHRIVAWNTLAENCCKYLFKGREVYIEGRIQARDYEDQEGNKRYVVEIIASKIEFLGTAEKENKNAV